MIKNKVLWNLVCALLFVETGGVSFAQETDPRLHSDGAGWKLSKAVIEDPRLPRVLLIGDSILVGYQEFVIADLKGKAYVDAWVNPYHQSEKLNGLLAEVLKEGPYDVVHFNMGLHGWPVGRIKEGTFEPLTKAYVEVIRKMLPDARLIWANSTPIMIKGQRGQLDPELNAIMIEHNRMAANVMNEMGVPISDFYSLLVPQHLNLARGDLAHWTPPAYRILADAAVASIEKALAEKPVKTMKAE